MQEAIVTPYGGFLLPAGYADPETDVQIVQFLEGHPGAILLDIRLRARSRWFSSWNKSRLQARWPLYYVHEPSLGNVNYQRPELPIELVNPARALEWIVPHLEDGRSFVLLCACKDYGKCHRKVVTEMLLQACQKGNGQ